MRTDDRVVSNTMSPQTSPESKTDTRTSASGTNWPFS